MLPHLSDAQNQISKRKLAFRASVYKLYFKIQNLSDVSHFTSQYGLTSSLQLVILLRKLKLIGRCGNYFLHYHKTDNIQNLK